MADFWHVKHWHAKYGLGGGNGDGGCGGGLLGIGGCGGGLLGDGGCGGGGYDGGGRWRKWSGDGACGGGGDGDGYKGNAHTDAKVMVQVAKLASSDTRPSLVT